MTESQSKQGVLPTKTRRLKPPLPSNRAGRGGFSRRLFLLVLIPVMSPVPFGCGGKGSQNAEVRRMPKPKEPPIPPPPKAVVIDPDLVATARRELELALEASDPTLRVHALEGLKETVGAEVGPGVVRALGDPQPPVRFAAAMAAGDLKLAAAKGTLLTKVEDPDHNVRVGVRYALHRLGVPTFSHDLERSAVDPDPRVRFTTSMVLGRMEEPSAIKVLKVLRADAHAAVRQQAAESLYRLGDDQGLQDLIGLSASQHPDDMMIGLMGLTVRHDQRVTEHVRVGLTADYAEVQLVAARAMGLVARRPNGPYDLGYVIARNATKANDPRQRLLAALALGSIGRADAQDALKGLLKDPDGDVRIAAGTALLQISRRPA